MWGSLGVAFCICRIASGSPERIDSGPGRLGRSLGGFRVLVSEGPVVRGCWGLESPPNQESGRGRGRSAVAAAPPQRSWPFSLNHVFLLIYTSFKRGPPIFSKQAHSLKKNFVFKQEIRGRLMLQSSPCMQLKNFCTSRVRVLNQNYWVWPFLPIHLTSISFPWGIERETGEELNHNGETRVSLEICFSVLFFKLWK